MNGKGIELPLCSSSNHRAPDLEADAQRLRLERALSLIPWRERLDLVIDARDRTPARAAPLEHGSWATPAQDERRHRRDEPHPQLHDVLRLRTQMMLGQDGAEQQASSAPPKAQANTISPRTRVLVINGSSKIIPRSCVPGA